MSNKGLNQVIGAAKLAVALALYVGGVFTGIGMCVWKDDREKERALEKVRERRKMPQDLNFSETSGKTGL